jgi:hypothetical protein
LYWMALIKVVLVVTGPHGCTPTQGTAVNCKWHRRACQQVAVQIGRCTRQSLRCKSVSDSVYAVRSRLPR